MYYSVFFVFSIIVLEIRSLFSLLFGLFAWWLIGFSLALCVSHGVLHFCLQGLIASSGTARVRGSTKAAGTGFEATASTRAALSATPRRHFFYGNRVLQENNRAVNGPKGPEPQSVRHTSNLFLKRELGEVRPPLLVPACWQWILEWCSTFSTIAMQAPKCRN